MNLDQFNNILANAQQDPQKIMNSLSDKKRVQLGQSADNKRNQLFKPRTEQNIQSIPDGDGYIATGDGQERRMAGYDSYEVAHPEKMQDPGFLKHLDIQRQRYAKEFNKPVTEVTNDDIFREGEKDKLRVAARMFGGVAGQTWEPGPIYNPNDPIEIGSEATPLDMVIQAREGKVGSGGYGRRLAQVNNAQGQNVNEAMMDPYNAMLFNAEKSKRGKSVPNIEGMNQQNLQQWIVQQRAQGIEPTPENIAEFKFKNDQGRKAQQERYKNTPSPEYAHLYGEQVDGAAPKYGRDADGRMMSNIKTVGAGLGNIGANLLDTVLEGGGYLANKAGIIDKDTQEMVGSVADSSLKGWEKAVGLNTRYQEKASRELMAGIVKGTAEGYGEAALSVVKNLDVHLAQSGPEMIGIAAKLPGVLATTNSRVKEQTAAFTKKNGREPTDAETAAMWATNFGVIAAEKAILIGPLKSIWKAMKNPAVKKGFQQVGNTVGASTKNVAKTVVGETVQEIADQTQEQYWNKGGSGDIKGIDAFKKAGQLLIDGKIISKEEAIAAGIAGGVMGGALRGGAELTGAKAAVENSINLHNFKKSLSDMDTYLDETDKEYARMSLEGDMDNARTERVIIQEARKQIKEAQKSSKPTIDVLSESNNNYIEKYVEGIKVAYVNNKASEIDYKDNPQVASSISAEALAGEPKDSANVIKALGLEPVAFKAMKPMEQLDIISEKIKDKATRAKAIRALSSFRKEAIFNKTVSDKDKIAFEKDYGSGIDNQLNVKETKVNATIANAKEINRRISKTKPVTRSDDKVDIDSSKIDSKVTAGNFLQSIFGGTKKNKAAHMAELNKYSNKSLREAVDSGSPEQVALIRDVLAKRSNAKKEAGIGTLKGQKFNEEGYRPVTSKMAINDDKKRTMNTLKQFVGRDEYANADSEANEARAFIQKALDAKHITKQQANILRRRVVKTQAKTKDREGKEKSESRKLKEAEAALVKHNNENNIDTEEDNRQYKFKDFNGNEYIGKIVFEDKNGGMLVVEHEVDGETERIEFGYEKGNQIKETDKETKYTGGKIHKVSDEKKSGSKESTESEPASSENKTEDEKEVAEEFDKEAAPLTGEAQAEAEVKANEEILGDFNVEDMTDEEIKEMSIILNQLFDC
ncbi:hypothetical protein J7J63_09525 [Candidatus Bipolaricaulota bacterium]|nr:hypothetical protein [Candidatus Bipolaricaulota bacterium]